MVFYKYFTLQPFSQPPFHKVNLLLKQRSTSRCSDLFFSVTLSHFSYSLLYLLKSINVSKSIFHRYIVLVYSNISHVRFDCVRVTGVRVTNEVNSTIEHHWVRHNPDVSAVDFRCSFRCVTVIVFRSGGGGNQIKPASTSRE